MNEAKMPASVPFYERDQFEVVKRLLAGTGAATDFTYDQWLANLEANEEMLRSMGHLPVRIPIRVPDAKAWIESNDMTFNRQSLATYAAHCLAEKIGHDRRMN